MIYILIGALIAILAYIEAIVRSRRFSHYSLIGILFTLLALACLRNEVGTDWVAYYNSYLEKTDKFEIGYTALNNKFSELGIHYNLFLLFVNGISLTMIYLFLRTHSAFFLIAILIFFSDLFLYFNLSGIRQAIAVSITCFSVTFALKRQFYYFLLAIIFASCFHLSALVFIVAYVIPRKNLDYRHLIAVPILLFIVASFLNSIADLITLYTLKNADYYVHLQDKAENLRALFYIGIIRRLIIVILVFTLGRQMLQYPRLRYYVNIYLFGLLIYLATYMVSPDIGVRLSSYFTIFDIVIAGNLIYVIQNRSARLLVVSIIVFISVYKLMGYAGDEYFEYKSILNVF